MSFTFLAFCGTSANLFSTRCEWCVVEICAAPQFQRCFACTHPRTYLLAACLYGTYLLAVCHTGRTCNFNMRVLLRDHLVRHHTHHCCHCRRRRGRHVQLALPQRRQRPMVGKHRCHLFCGRTCGWKPMLVEWVESFVAADADAQLWHNRFNHLGHDNMARLVEREMVMGVNVLAGDFAACSLISPA